MLSKEELTSVNCSEALSLDNPSDNGNFALCVI
jgi:hypothetical protein